MGIETVLLGASLGVSLFGARSSKREAKRAQAGQLAFDARSAKLESKSILEEAALEAVEIRREGELLGKGQRALTAKAGAKLGVGTARDIQEETKRLTEKDVTTTLSAAERKSEQLLTTFGASEHEVVSGGEFKKFKEFQKKSSALSQTGMSPSAIESELFQNENFIKSKKPVKPFTVA